MSLIQIEGLTKKFGKRILFENLNFSFSPGIYWLKGSNGQGKSTFLDIVAGMDRNITGRVKVNRQKMLYLTNHPIGLFPYTVSENLSILFKTFKLKLSGKQEGILHDFLGNSLSDPYSALSTGQRMKLGLSLVLMSEWDIILLDETLSTIDTTSRAIICKRLDHLVISKGTLVIYVSHGEVSRTLAESSTVVRIKERGLVYE